MQKIILGRALLFLINHPCHIKTQKNIKSINRNCKPTPKGLLQHSTWLLGRGKKNRKYNSI